MSDWLDEALASLEASRRRRHLAALGPLQSTRVRLGDHTLTLFSSNDYLGLAQHPDVRAAAAHTAMELGMGPRGSALICGYTELTEALESELAALKGAPSALVFPTGYAANLGVLAALGGPDLEIFSDALNHASIIDGCRLARSRVHIYRHRDPEHLADLLAASSAPRKLIVTDGLFSMDGEIAPLTALVDLKERYGAMLAVDEAHATLLYGERGAGVIEAAGLSEIVDLQIGTLSKAIGSQGGYVACSHRMRAWILNRARSYVFSTALAAPLVAAAREALAVFSREPERRVRLWQHVAEASRVLGVSGESPILPVLLETEERALDVSRALFERGYHVTAIRPPTVPEGTSRIRITLSAEHQPDEVAGLLAALHSCHPRS